MTTPHDDPRLLRTLLSPHSTHPLRTGFRVVASLGAAVLAFGAACTTSDPRKNVSDDLETPAYTTLETSDKFEIRRYEPYIKAVTDVEADSYDKASRVGFRRLGGYIFGDNKGKAEVAMTAPVGATPSPSDEPNKGEGEEIAMTAPVAATPQGTKSWRISFMMPSKYTMEALPTPDDDRVKFVQEPMQCSAAVVFSGFTPEATVDEMRGELLAWVKARGETPAGETTLARYNDPLTLPWNRRNELIVPLRDAACPSS